MARMETQPHSAFPQLLVRSTDLQSQVSALQGVVGRAEWSGGRPNGPAKSQKQRARARIWRSLHSHWIRVAPPATEHELSRLLPLVARFLHALLARGAQ